MVSEKRSGEHQNYRSQKAGNIGKPNREHTKLLGSTAAKKKSFEFRVIRFPVAFTQHRTRQVTVFIVKMKSVEYRCSVAGLRYTVLFVTNGLCHSRRDLLVLLWEPIGTIPSAVPSIGASTPEAPIVVVEDFFLLFREFWQGG